MKVLNLGEYPKENGKSSESDGHVALKKRAAGILLSLGIDPVFEAKIPNFSCVVDVAGFKNNIKIAFECGDVSQGKIESLKLYYDIVVHMPYCWTPGFFIHDRKLTHMIENEMFKR